jgi:hypothetical protein
MKRLPQAEQVRSCGTVGRINGLRRKAGKPVTPARAQKGLALRDGSQRAGSNQKMTGSLGSAASAALALYACMNE